jgi:hypothetical protein
VPATGRTKVAQLLPRDNFNPANTLCFFPSSDSTRIASRNCGSFGRDLRLYHAIVSIKHVETDRVSTVPSVVRRGAVMWTADGVVLHVSFLHAAIRRRLV